MLNCLLLWLLEGRTHYYCWTDVHSWLTGFKKTSCFLPLMKVNKIIRQKEKRNQGRGYNYRYILFTNIHARTHARKQVHTQTHTHQQQKTTFIRTYIHIHTKQKNAHKHTRTHFPVNNNNNNKNMHTHTHTTHTAEVTLIVSASRSLDFQLSLTHGGPHSVPVDTNVALMLGHLPHTQETWLADSCIWTHWLKPILSAALLTWQRPTWCWRPWSGKWLSPEWQYTPPPFHPPTKFVSARNYIQMLQRWHLTTHKMGNLQCTSYCFSFADVMLPVDVALDVLHSALGDRIVPRSRRCTSHAGRSALIIQCTETFP